MARYVDGFVVAVPEKKIKDYQALSKKASKVFMEHGALQYCEAVGDDLDVPFGLPFTKAFKTKPGEVHVFAFIVYKSRAHRDRVNKKMMADPRMNEMPKEMPFDVKRMCYGGFSMIVDVMGK